MQSKNSIQIPDKLLAKVAEEFNVKFDESNKSFVIPLERTKQVSIEEEETHFNTFYDKETGVVYYSQPGIPLPLKLSVDKDNIVIEVHECTEDYGIVYRRQVVNLVRNIRFFIYEIVNDALHFCETKQQVEHPLNAK